MNYFCCFNEEIIEINDNNMFDLIQNNKLKECEWHSGTVPTSYDMQNEYSERNRFDANKYLGYHEEKKYKFIYDIKNKKCYDNCNYNNRLDNMNAAQKIGDKIKNEKKPEITELETKKKNINLMLDKNKKLIKTNNKIIEDLKKIKIKIDETKLITQIKKISNDIDIKQKENENLDFVTKQLIDKLIEIDEIYKFEYYDEILNMDSILLGQQNFICH